MGSNRKENSIHSGSNTIKATDASSKSDENGGMTAYWRIFTFADKLTWMLNGVALVTSVASGVLLPLMNLVFGKFVTAFNNFAIGATGPEDFRSDLVYWTLWFIYFFIAKFVLSYIWLMALSVAAIRSTKALKIDFLKSTVRQDISFFDSSSTGSISTQVTTNGNLVNQGISEKLGLTIQGISTFFAAFVVAFIVQWKLTLITICIVPTILVVVSITVAIDAKLETDILPIYSKAGRLAEEVFASIGTVHAFWAHPRLSSKYENLLLDAKSMGMKKSPNFAIMFSTEFFCISAGYALSFWQGIRMYSSGEIAQSGVIVTVIFAVVTAATALTQVAPQAIVIAKAASAASELFGVIDREPQIDSLSDRGKRPQKCEGVIEVKNVQFSYPSRSDVPVLKDISFSIPADKVTALVGASGCGKSTIVALLERWYNPQNGLLFLDGHDIRELNIQWLRTTIRLVQQEPVLFNGTVYENIEYGLIGTSFANAQEYDKRKLVHDACKSASAHEFIESLPQGYNTEVGERAAMLSGGQKQRIAIARSIVSNPRVLLLDEATSALDPKAERIVQEALDNVSISRTTLVIAHKLSTVRKADNIIVISKGAVVEQGTHEELVTADGAYARLVKAQDLGQGQRESAESHHGESLGRKLSVAHTNSQSVRSMLAKDDIGNSQATMEYGLLKCISILFREQKSLYGWFLFSLITCLVGGLTNPAVAIVFSNVMKIFQLPRDGMTNQGNFYALMFFIIAVVNLVVYAITGWVANMISQVLTHKYRLELFDHTLRQDRAFFDKPENTVGAIVSRLSTQPTHLNELLSFNAFLILIILFNLLSSCILALAYGWRLAVVVIFGALPPILLAGYLRMRLELKLDDDTNRRFSDSAAIAAEAISAMRTVASLTMEQHIIDRYTSKLDGIEKKSIKSLFFTMFWYSLSQSINFLALALGFWYGGHLMSTGEYNSEQFFIVFIAVLFSGEAAAQFLSYTTSITKAQKAANYMSWLRQKEPSIREKGDNDPNEPGDKSADDGAHVECDALEFCYPQRPNTKVIQGISVEVNHGETVAFVGASGCGKSTMIALLERFYDPTTGSIKFNNTEITNMCPRQYRRNLALVQQEPTLYQFSIRDNIALGLEAAATDEQIEEASHQANVYEFISSLPEGMGTLCGSKGTQLSGGQKQRIAIARALIRKPRLLLLDEATSALDTESEKVVQAALEKASSGRTTIAVAHRLSTIKDANRILVFAKGRIVEAGTHAELLARRGVYYEMCLGQSLDREM